MSDEESNDTQAMPDRADDRDWFLQEFVYFANRHGLKQGMTLMVSGLVISGTLIGGKEYFEALAEEMASVVTDVDTREAVRRWVSRYGAIYDRDEKEPDKETAEELPPPPSFIHLGDARIWLPGDFPVPTSRGILWRGRLTSVDGFIVGELVRGE